MQINQRDDVRVKTLRPHLMQHVLDNGHLRVQELMISNSSNFWKLAYFPWCSVLRVSNHGQSWLLVHPSYIRQKKNIWLTSTDRPYFSVRPNSFYTEKFFFFSKICKTIPKNTKKCFHFTCHLKRNKSMLCLLPIFILNIQRFRPMWYVCEVVSLCSILYFLVDGSEKKKSRPTDPLWKKLWRATKQFFFLA